MKKISKLQGKTAIVTGASRGIGKAIAIKFLSEGANVIITYINEIPDSQSLNEELSQYEGKFSMIKSDASSYLDAQDLAKKAIQTFGRVDILVNNAGITKDGLIMRMSETQWDDVISTNLKSVFNTVKAFTPTMVHQKSGSIINISSIVGIDGNKGQANYVASKAGIIGFTKAIALELGSRNIRSNAIAPGFISTDMTKHLNPEAVETWIKTIPLGRAGTVDDVANCALFLASEDSSYITGEVIRVDGGIR